MKIENAEQFATGYGMSTDHPPLSHHNILHASAAFAQRGLRTDLAASDRGARRITFVPAADNDRGDDELRLRYDLYLLPPDPPVLIRVAHLGPLQATLSTQGDDSEALLDALARVPPDAQFRVAGRAHVADSFDIDPAPGSTPRLTACATLIDDLLIETDARTVVGEPMETTLRQVSQRGAWQLPDDLLALAYRGWRPLTETDEGWRTTLKVPVREPLRSRETRRRFADMARTVANTLARPPAAYHRDHRLRRWAIYLWRFVPLGVCVAIVAALPLLDRYVWADNTQLHPLFLSLPPVLMVGAMVLTWRDTPRIEVPPRPRHLETDAWSTEPS